MNLSPLRFSSQRNLTKAFATSLAVFFSFCATTAFAAWRPGLQWGSLSSGSSINTTDFPAVTNVDLTTSFANTSSGWGNNTTYVYWGNIYLDGSSYRFGERIDDATFLKINGETVLNDNVWNSPSYATVTLPAGWYSFELRVYNGTGGAGATSGNGFTNTKGFACAYGLTPEEANAISSGTDLSVLTDPGDASLFRYDDGTGFDNTLEISGNPSAIGSVSPAYGLVNDLKDGDSFTCSIASPSVTTPDGLVYSYSGYIFDKVDYQTGEVIETISSGDNSATSFTFSYPGVRTRITWQWNFLGISISPFTATPDRGSVTAPFLASENETITLTATPAPGFSFFGWTGVLPDGVDASSPTLTFAVDKSYSPEALFSANFYVAKDAPNPTAPYNSWETASPDVEAVVALAQSVNGTPATIYIGEGQFSVTSPYLLITNPVSLIGIDRQKSILACNKSASHSPLYLKNPLASAEKLGLTGGNWYGYSNPISNIGAGGVRIDAGTLRDCAVYNNEGCDYTAGVLIYDGLITNCVIYGNYAVRWNNQSAATGAGMRIEGGLVVDCVITNNRAAGNNGGNASGVKILGGTLRNSLISENYSSNSGRLGVGIVVSGGLVENCIISKNYNAASGAGLNQTAGTVRNCLIYGNIATDQGAGAYITGGTFEFNTVTKNTSTTQNNSGVYLSGGNAVVRNNIIYGNGAGVSAEALCNIDFRSAKTFTGNIVSPATSGVGNIDADPLFTNFNGDDFRIGAGSPAIDAAPVPATDLPTDLLGATRPKDGDADGTPAFDIGCYEADGANEGALRCSISASKRMAHGATEITLSATVAGEGSAGPLSYSWNLNGGTILETTDGGATIRALFSDYGRYSVSLTVNAENGTSATKEIADFIQIGAAKVYINTNGNGTWPYATPETATNDLCEVVNSAIYVGDTTLEILADDGEFPILEKWAIITAPIWLHSVNGPEHTSFYGANPANRFLRAAMKISNANALIEDITIRDCNWDGNVTGDASHGVVLMEAGLMRNCVLTNNRGGTRGGALYLSGGRAENLHIYYNEASGNSNPGIGVGGGVYITGSGVIADSLIEGNYAIAHSGGVFMESANAMVTNCVIANNRTGIGIISEKGRKSKTGRYGGGVTVTAGSVIDCSITGNFANGAGGGIYIDGSNAQMVNCLVANNASCEKYHAGFVKNGKLINCTIAGNGLIEGEECALASSALYLDESAKVLNSIIWNNDECTPQVEIKDVAANRAQTIANSCAPEFVSLSAEAKNIAIDPRFRNPSAHDFRLRSTSPCIDTADPAFLPASTVFDLLGKPRFFHGLPDLGCYERNTTQTIMLLR